MEGHGPVARRRRPRLRLHHGHRDRRDTGARRGGALLSAAAPLSPWEVETPMTAPDRARPVPRRLSDPRVSPPAAQRHLGDRRRQARPAKARSASSSSSPSRDATDQARAPSCIPARPRRRRDGNWGTAERLADLNAAVIAIDSPEHGSRSSGGSGITAAFSFFGVDPSDNRLRHRVPRQLPPDDLRSAGAGAFIRTLGTLDLLPVGRPTGFPISTSRASSTSVTPSDPCRGPPSSPSPPRSPRLRGTWAATV